MARSKLRAVAGAGSVAAFLLVGGAAVPVVSADPGTSHHDNGAHRGGDRHDGYGRRGDRDRDDGGSRRGGDPIGPDRTTDPNRTINTGGLEPADVPAGARMPDGSDVVTRSGTSRSGVVTTSPVRVADLPVTVNRSAGGVTPPATLTPIPSGPALPAAPAVPVSGGGGSGAGAVTAPPIAAPRVTIGNGRSPGILSGRHDAPTPKAVAPDAAPVEAPPAVAPQPPPSFQLDEAPAELVVASLWEAAVPGWPSGLLFGIAGLILAPMAGAWLGYRQAKASRAAAKLVRH
jgi:hypothetical protein